MFTLPKIQQRTAPCNAIMALICVCTVLAVSGCASAPPVPAVTQADAAPERLSEPASPLGNIEYHTFLLANELFAGLIPKTHNRYAVAGFVPVEDMQYNGQRQQPLMLLGHQLEQGLMTEAVNRGFVAKEFKLANSIIMSDDADRILSRNTDHLSGLSQVDFFISGTLVHQQNGAVVNARIIDAKSRDVIAAATRFFPVDLFWETEQVSLRGNKLIRISPTEGN